MGDEFKFNISLSVLNHLGRNLYRNFITVIGEAISNAWDADAKNVKIYINEERSSMIIEDDGIGMTKEDFEGKFLKIGYTKRSNNIFKSPSGRPFIGRKGIGKLALLSCAKQIQIVSKTEKTDIIGGTIDNSELDKAIKDDVSANEYILGPLSQDTIDKFNNKKNGTLINFIETNDKLPKTIDYIKKLIALYFRFSILDNDFKIYVNDEVINEKQLSDLAKATQFIWVINDYNDNYIADDSLKNLISRTKKESNYSIKGFIATTEKPKDIKIRGTDEKVTLDLFVNGRLREKDILKYIPTARIVENYTYGQIFFDELDYGNCIDRFTSSREGIADKNDAIFQQFIKELGRIYKDIIEQWDVLRRKNNLDGDPDNKSISKKARKSKELVNTVMEDMNLRIKHSKEETIVDAWIKRLTDESEFNIPAYTECFVAENLLRKYIEHKKMTLSEKTISSAKQWREKSERSKKKANISYQIRQNVGDIYYLDMADLANFVDKPVNENINCGISRSAIVYKPIRDAVGHTSLITTTAKQQLNIEFKNIRDRLVQIMEETRQEEIDKNKEKKDAN